MKPYTDEILEQKTWIRTFDPHSTKPEEFVWHRDTEDRCITVLEGTDWMFQFDNELPKVINTNSSFFIPKMVYHRLIPGNTKLKIKIEEQMAYKLFKERLKRVKENIENAEDQAQKLEDSKQDDVEEMSKLELDEYAENQGVSLDRRKSKKQMVKDFNSVLRGDKNEFNI